MSSNNYIKHNIESLLYYNKVSKDDLNKIVDYKIIKNYGHLILNNFGSSYFDDLEFKIIKNHIENISENEINQIISHSFLVKFKDIIINKFGNEYYNKKMKAYN